MFESQGIREPFSTGSQPQYPPQPSTLYAHTPPMMKPVARIAVENTAHGSTSLIQPSYSRRTSAAIAIANGITSEENPVNSTGGWIVIHGSWSSGFRPLPSIGA